VRTPRDVPGRSPQIAAGRGAPRGRFLPAEFANGRHLAEVARPSLAYLAALRSPVAPVCRRCQLPLSTTTPTIFAPDAYHRADVGSAMPQSSMPSRGRRVPHLAMDAWFPLLRPR